MWTAILPMLELQTHPVSTFRGIMSLLVLDDRLSLRNFSERRSPYSVKVLP